MSSSQPPWFNGKEMTRSTLAFRVTLDNVERCGQTCRDLTLTLANIGTTVAHDITIDATLSTGGNVVWAGSKAIGTLAVDESQAGTVRVNLSYEDGLRVRRNDNIVTAKMIVRAAEGDVILTKTVDVTTLEPANAPIPDLRKGQVTSYTVDQQEYYLIDQIPGEPPNRVAVTTPEYQLISVDRARKVIRKDTWQGMSWGLDWRDEINRTQTFRENQASNRAFGRALDLGWDITEILIYVAAGFPQASVGPVLDAATDTVTWAVRDVQRPYREAFQKMTAAMTNASNVQDLATQVTSRDDLGEQLQLYIDGLLALDDAIDKSTTLATAWKQVFSSEVNYGTTSVTSTALAASKSFFIGLAVSTAAGEFESAIKNKSKIHGVSHAFATVRLPLLHRLQSLDSRFSDGTYRFGDGIEYYLNLQTSYQMYALAYAATATYWQQISDSATGIVWDTLVNAQEKAANNRRTAKTMEETAKIVGRLLGQVLNKIDTRTQQSLNTELKQQEAQQKLGRGVEPT